MSSVERLLLVVALTALAGCGREVPQGGLLKTPDDVAAKDEDRRPAQAADLIPADLDLVLRVDLSKVRDNLGPDAGEQLIGRAVDVAGAEGLVRSTLAEAEIVWLGLRMADVESGDRVLAVRTLKTRGEQKPAVEPDNIAFERDETDVEGLVRFKARGRTKRGGTERIFALGDREAIFVSPVESQSVERILRTHADPDRGQPVARGLVSLDYRTGPLSHAHENAYPSLAALLAGMIRVQGTIDIVADRLELDGRIQCRTITSAAKVQRFLDTIVGAASRRPQYAELLAELKIERNESVVSVIWPMPRAVVAALLANEPSPTPAKEPKPTDAPEPAPEPKPATPEEPAPPAPSPPEPAVAPPPSAPPPPISPLDRPIELPPRPDGISPDP